jgi:serine/threonine protein kinase
MTYFMSNTSASASKDITEPDNNEDDEGTVLKAPLKPLLNEHNAAGCKKESELLDTLCSAWSSAANRDRPMPYPQVVHRGVDKERPHILLRPYGTSLSLIDEDEAEERLLADDTLAVNVINDVLRALEMAHTLVSPPIFHKDVRSPNIIVVKKKRAVLIDWGHGQ